MGRSSEPAVIDRLFRWGSAVGDDDARLLERFRDGRDEAAFAALVDRHGPMVLGVCRRSLRDKHDVEDAFQATFLILARRAGTIRGVGGVGPWLHGVARRVATRARADSARRFVREGARLESEPAAVPSGRDAERAESRAVVDDELARLPARFREPVILCHLEGLTHDQAAERLRLPVGTVRSRLSRARSKLRDRLERRGLSAADALAPVPLAEPLAPTLLEATVRASLASVSASTSASTLAAAGAVALADGVLRTMFIPKAKLAAVALGAFLALAGATGHALQQAPTDAADAPPKQAAPPADTDEDLARGLRESVAGMEKDLAAVREKLAALEAKIAAKAPQPDAATPTATPEQAPASGARIPTTYLAPRNSPTIIPVEDGHVATVFLFSDYVTTPGDDSKPAAPPDFQALKVGESDRRSVRLAAEGSPPIEVSWIEAGPFQALFMKGDRIERLAVYDGGEWFVQELAEPAREVSPVINPTMASYAIGRRIYNYSHPAKRWDVLELPEGAEPNAMTDPVMILKHGDQYHRYDVETGRWTRMEVHLPPEFGRQLEGMSVGGFH